MDPSAKAVGCQHHRLTQGRRVGKEDLVNHLQLRRSGIVEIVLCKLLLECQCFKLCIMDCKSWIWIRIRLVPLLDGDFLNPRLSGFGELLGGCRKVSIASNESEWYLTSVGSLYWCSPNIIRVWKRNQVEAGRLFLRSILIEGFHLCAPSAVVTYMCMLDVPVVPSHRNTVRSSA